MKYSLLVTLVLPAAFAWFWQDPAPAFLAKFTDIAASAKLLHPTIHGPVDHKDYILEATGCGAAFLDFDNDGWLDVLMLSGTRFKNPPSNTGNRLYRNNGNGTFSDVTAAKGLIKVGWASSVTVGDFDNDGFEDLFITYWGQNILYRNENGTFKDVTSTAGLLTTDRRWTSGASFLDFDRDGNLDLFFTEYLDFDPTKIAKPGDPGQCNWKGIPVNCGPKGLPMGRHHLYHGNGKGGFKDTTQASGVDKAAPLYGMTTVVADYDEDGWVDIYIASDSTPSQMLINQHNGTFLDQGLARGVAVSEDGVEQAGMGVALGDFFREGRLSIFKTNFADDTSNLYQNLGQGQFTDQASRKGLSAKSRFMNWGAGAEDLDNDGWPDIFFVGGNVFPEVERKLPAYPHKAPRMLYRGTGNGRFAPVLDSTLTVPHSSRGAAFGDFDNDGDIDILIVNLNEAPSLLRNNLPPNAAHWLNIKLEGTSSNRSAIGATVIATFAGKPLAKSVTSQESFYSVNDRRLHFGLGASTKANIEIRWPSGKIEKLSDLGANRLHQIREGQGVIAP